MYIFDTHFVRNTKRIIYYIMNRHEHIKKKVLSTVPEFYNTLQSRVGYQLFLGGTRHFGYYARGTWWPFPVHHALRAMEEHLCRTMGLKNNALVLSAGAGICKVAIYMAKKGLRVKAIDAFQMHVDWVEHNIMKRKMGDCVHVSQSKEQAYLKLELKYGCDDKLDPLT